ncbi:MAG: endonuclease III domain-containing protein [Candidatus Omnitrophica bacterium]|nr:endonuclease III domain-containing protein [Candidatus Omnitrophota bacterium]
MTRAYRSIQRTLSSIYSVLSKEYGPQHWWPARTRFEVIIGAILTQNTSWPNVEKAIANLRQAGLLSVKSINEISLSRLAKLIRPSGYYNVKASRIKNFMKFLYGTYGGNLSFMFSRDLHRLRHELLSVKGLGKETVDSILLYAGGKPIFVVDAYTKRILSRHSLIDGGADYDAIQGLFMDNLPRARKLYNEYHALLVKLAKDVCKSTPRCNICPIRELF